MERAGAGSKRERKWKRAEVRERERKKKYTLLFFTTAENYISDALFFMVLDKMSVSKRATYLMRISEEEKEEEELVVNDLSFSLTPILRSSLKSIR